jgi:SAM-dependent methyltransferase
MNALVKHRDTCRACGSADLLCSMPMPQVPIVSPNVGGNGEALATVTAPLDNYLCRDCGLIQMLSVVDPALIYGNYLYRTAVSLGLAEHFKGLAHAVIERLALRPGDLVVEFGSNDGTLLNFFRDAGMRVQGVDPARAIAAEATARGIPTRSDYFTEAVAGEIAAEQGPARAVLANNALANIDDLGDVLGGVRTLLADDGGFVFETQYALDVFDKFLLDALYHEHITCFSVKPVANAFRRHGLKVFDAERIPMKGGSIRFWMQGEGGARPQSPGVAELIDLEEQSRLYDPDRHGAFAARAAETRDALHSLIAETRAGGETVAAYGTSVGCAALIHQFELQDKIDVLYDDSPFKDEIEGPGYRLPVRHGDALAAAAPGLVILLAWRYAEPIASKQQAYLRAGGRIVVPLPTLGELRA